MIIIHKNYIKSLFLYDIIFYFKKIHFEKTVEFIILARQSLN